MKEFFFHPWPWWFSGIVISATMFFLIFSGKHFSCSSNFRTICSAAGLGKKNKFFDFNWKNQTWNLMFLFGAIIGGYVAHVLLSDGEPVKVAENTIRDLQALGIAKPTSIQPEELFGLNALFTLKGFSILAIGGLLIGFGSRYAGGCTSGHAISGLSNLQLPSLLSVIGFFIGGLIMTHYILPLILK